MVRPDRCSFSARRAREYGDETARARHLQAAKHLIDSVHLCLGNPVSQRFPMAKDQMGQYKGLRIGKTMSRIPTDNGMTYDGMYWHYLDKVMIRFPTCMFSDSERDAAEMTVCFS